MSKRPTRLPKAPRGNYIVPKYGETWQQRHARRLTVALECRSNLQAWCDERSVSLRLWDTGTHWKLARPWFRAVRTVEWWPSSGRVVVNGDGRNPLKVHDVVGLKRIAAEVFGGVPKKGE